MDNTEDFPELPADVNLRAKLVKVVRRPRDAYAYCVSHVRGFYYKWLLCGVAGRVVIGRNFRLRGKLTIRGPGRVIIGDHVFIDGRGHPVTLFTHAAEAVIQVGRDVFLNGTRIGCVKRVEIGDRCILGDARIADTDFHGISPKDRRNPAAIVSRPVLIHENVWLGMAVLVLKGVVIGQNSVIGAGSIVTDAIPQNCVATGNPARVVKRFREDDVTFEMIAR